MIEVLSAVSGESAKPAPYIPTFYQYCGPIKACPNASVSPVVCAQTHTSIPMFAFLHTSFPVPKFSFSCTIQTSDYAVYQPTCVLVYCLLLWTHLTLCFISRVFIPEPANAAATGPSLLHDSAGEPSQLQLQSCLSHQDHHDSHQGACVCASDGHS